MAAKTTPAKNKPKAEAAKKPAKPADAPKKGAKDKPSKADGLERHPLSERYGPIMSAEELGGLAADIKAHGQHEPIIMFEGKVLAGWNRYKACLLAKQEPKLREMDPGSDPAAVAFGTNFMRRKLSSVQKAFYGAQFCLESNGKQSDVATMLACNLNRLNQSCQLLKLETTAAKKVIEELRSNPEMGSAVFDEHMLELGIAKPVEQRAPRPARAGGGADVLDTDDDIDFEDDDITGGAIDGITDAEDDEASPPPATRKGKGSKPGDPIGTDEPLPAVGKSRGNSMVNPHETPVSRAAKHFKALSAEEQRKFVKFTWGKLKPALDAAFSNADVAYEMPGVKPDPSVIVRGKPADKLDDGHPTPAKKGAANKGKDKPGKGGGKDKPKPGKTPPPKKPGKPGKHAAKEDDI